MEKRYRTYTIVLATAFALAAMFSVSGCSDAIPVSENDTPTLKQHMFVLPDRLTGQPYSYATPTKAVYLDTNETVKFWAAYSINDVYMSSDTADNHFLNHSWTIEDEEYNISPLRFSFKTPGYRMGILQTVDLFSDTLRDTLNIFVNSPIGISIIAPVNGYNQVKPVSNSEVEIRWSISGLDPWEAHSCRIYAAFKKDEVWDHDLGSVNCYEDARFVGPFLTDSLIKYLTEHPEQDTSVTIYWGMIAKSYTDDGFQEADSSEIHHFSTQFLHEDSSVIVIPIAYDSQFLSSLYTQVVITDNKGDTLLVEHKQTNPSTIRVKVAPQTGIRIYAQELNLTEFVAEPETTNAQTGSLTILDTIRFYDKTQPQVAPRTLISHTSGRYGGTIMNDSVYFYTLDNGSGINPMKITVTINNDTILHHYTEPFIKFRAPYENNSKIRIHVEDYAHNASPKVYWKFDRVDSYPKITGPFSETGGN